MQLQLYGKSIWIFNQPVDFRCSIDGLSAHIVNDVKHQPQEGIYIFFNRGRDKIKCLSWHKNGFVLLYKRLEIGRFHFIPTSQSGVISLNATELGWLLAGLEWQKMRDWKDLSYAKFG